MSDNEYSGWRGYGDRSSAYATWRVNLELISDRDDWSEVFDEKPAAEELAEYLEYDVSEVVFMDDQGQLGLVSQYAAAFLSDVNYREIAEHILSDWPEDETEEEDEVEQ